MNTDELVETLNEAGLSPYQSAAYVTLLELGRVSAQELAAASDVPGPRIYDVLDSLEEKGFIVTYEREQLYAEAVAPDTGVSALTSRIDQLSDAVEEIQTRWHQPTSDIIDIGVVKQFETVLARARSNIEAAQRQVLVALTFDQFLALESTLRAAHERGISIQLALHYSPERSLSAETFAGACTEVRVGETPCMYEPFITLVDGDTVCFAPFAREPPAEYQLADQRDTRTSYGVLIDDPIHAYIFEWYFLAALWEPSAALYTQQDGEPPIAFVDIRELIRLVDPLLRNGDTVYATVQGRSVRTGRPREETGRIVSVRSDSSESPSGTPMQSLLTREATIVLDIEDGEVTLGGKGAYNEDIETSRVIVTEVVSNQE